MIKELLVNSSEFHRVFIFCDRDNEGNISGLNPMNFQDETANSLLKIIEEPQPRITFIFLTNNSNDLLKDKTKAIVYDYLNETIEDSASEPSSTIN